MLYHNLPAHRDTRPIKRIAVLLCALTVVLFGVYISFKYSTSQPSVVERRDSDVLIKVGNENLYYKDFEMELSQYPGKEEESAKAVLTQKLITDSIILQGAQEENLVGLDFTTFNSFEKDYTKRIELIETIKRQLEERSVDVEGYVVAIWFRNNGYIGPLGLTKSQELARQKINTIWKEVSGGRMAIQKAGEVIINDASLAQLDLAYKNNAIYSFSASNGDQKPISLNEDLDTELKGLPVGGVSAVYLGKGKDPDTQESYDAMYAFGQITQKNTSSQTFVSFDEWLESKKDIYIVSM